MSLSKCRSVFSSASLVLAGSLFLAACGRKSGDPQTADDAKPASGDFVQIDKETTPDERRYLELGRAVFVNLCAHDYAAFHAQLSSHATARLSLNQFSPADDDDVFARQEAQPKMNVKLADFLPLMTTMEQRFGRPEKPKDLHVYSTDAAILAGKKREGLDALDVMFAIGNMPDLVPAAQRKASLRGQIRARLSPAQMAQAAREMQTTPDELAKDPEFEPYLNLKLVVIEENGRLCVGYFEFLPPSMMD